MKLAHNFFGVGIRYYARQIAPAFDAISAIAAHQCMLAPYYSTLFHQNRERHVLDRVTPLKRRFALRGMGFRGDTPLLALMR